MDNVAEVIMNAKSVAKEAREHVRTGYNKWQLETAIVRLEDSLKKASLKDTKTEEAWSRLAILALSIVAVFLGISGLIFQNQFSGFAFFIVATAIVMVARTIRRLAG